MRNGPHWRRGRKETAGKPGQHPRRLAARTPREHSSLVQVIINRAQHLLDRYEVLAPRRVGWARQLSLILRASAVRNAAQRWRAARMGQRAMAIPSLAGWPASTERFRARRRSHLAENRAAVGWKECKRCSSYWFLALMKGAPALPAVQDVPYCKCMATCSPYEGSAVGRNRTGEPVTGRRIAGSQCTC